MDQIMSLDDVAKAFPQFNHHTLLAHLNNTYDNRFLAEQIQQKNYLTFQDLLKEINLI